MTTEEALARLEGWGEEWMLTRSPYIQGLDQEEQIAIMTAHVWERAEAEPELLKAVVSMRLKRIVEEELERKYRRVDVADASQDPVKFWSDRLSNQARAFFNPLSEMELNQAQTELAKVDPSSLSELNRRRLDNLQRQVSLHLRTLLRNRRL